MFFSLLFIGTFSAPQSSETLTIHAEHFEHNNGKAVINLFREEDDIPKKPFKQQSNIIADGKSTIVFEDIPYGEYAAILFHDENSNGKIDHSWGFPAEPMGFSNRWRLTLFSGMPSFSKLHFEFSELKSTYIIAVEE